MSLPLTQVDREDLGRLVDGIAPVREKLAGTTLLITGAGGFLMRYMAIALCHMNDHVLSAPCRMILVDNGVSGSEGRLSAFEAREDCQVVAGDVTTLADPEGSVDWVVHGASIASPVVYRQFPLETVDANVGGTRRTLDIALAKKAKGYLLMSSSEIYGNPPREQVPTVESYLGNVSCMGPRACYDESKRLAETLAWIYHEKHQVPVKVIRPFNVFGPGQALNDGRVMPDFLGAAVAAKPLAMYSDGSATRAFCYIADFVEGIFHLLLNETAGQAFNVGDGRQEISMGDLAETVAAVAGRFHGTEALPVERHISADADYLTDNPERRCPNIAKVTDVTGWTPKIDLEEGIRRCLSHYTELEVALKETAQKGPATG